MSSSPVLSVSGLSKRYCRDLRRSHRYALQDIARALIGANSEPSRLRTGEFWALENLSFTLDRGEALAVLGANGSGKSTLLKIIFGLLKPDAGEVRVRGSVGAIIELGSNLSPLLTGRENIAVGAAAHRLSAREARALLDSVIDFADIGDAIDAPLQSYSSGMKARLAFALAVHFRHELLLVDEVLAVGDLEFQRKCIEWMRRYQEDGGSLIFVSHILQQVQVICSRAMLLDHGKVLVAGQTPHVVRRYLEHAAAFGPEAPQSKSQASDARLHIESIELTQGGAKTARSGEDALVRIRFDAREPLTAYCGVTIWTADGSTCITSTFAPEGRAIPPGKSTVECLISRLPLVPGRYILRPIIADRVAHVRVPIAGPAASGMVFDVGGEPDLFTNGQLQMGQLVAIDGNWKMEALRPPAGMPAQSA